LQKIDFESKKLKLAYPCEWQYKIIGTNQQELQQAVKRVLPKKKYTLSPSKQSQGGKYFSMNLKLTVQNEGERNQVYQTLKGCSEIKMVL